MIREREHVGIGWDVAGTIDAIGPEVTAFAAGDRVIGLRDRLDQPLGTYAERIVLDAADVAAAPTGVTSVAASTIPLNALTAVQALDALGLAAGQTILVTGAAGGLGGFGVELAAMRGLRVIAAAGDADENIVRELGAANFVPRSADLAEAARDLCPAGWTRSSTRPCWDTRLWTRRAAEECSPRSCCQDLASCAATGWNRS